MAPPSFSAGAFSIRVIMLMAVTLVTGMMVAVTVFFCIFGPRSAHHHPQHGGSPTPGTTAADSKYAAYGAGTPEHTGWNYRDPQTVTIQEAFKTTITEPDTAVDWRVAILPPAASQSVWVDPAARPTDAEWAGLLRRAVSGVAEPGGKSRKNSPCAGVRGAARSGGCERETAALLAWSRPAVDAALADLAYRQWRDTDIRVGPTAVGAGAAEDVAGRVTVWPVTAAFYVPGEPRGRVARLRLRVDAGADDPAAWRFTALAAEDAGVLPEADVLLRDVVSR